MSKWDNTTQKKLNFKYFFLFILEFSAKTSLSQKERGERYLSTIHYFLLHQIMSRQENYDK